MDNNRAMQKISVQNEYINLMNKENTTGNMRDMLNKYKDADSVAEKIFNAGETEEFITAMTNDAKRIKEFESSHITINDIRDYDAFFNKHRDLFDKNNELIADRLVQNINRFSDNELESLSDFILSLDTEKKRLIEATTDSSYLKRDLIIDQFAEANMPKAKDFNARIETSFNSNKIIYKLNEMLETKEYDDAIIDSLKDSFSNVIDETTTNDELINEAVRLLRKKRYSSLNHSFYQNNKHALKNNVELLSDLFENNSTKISNIITFNESNPILIKRKLDKELYSKINSSTVYKDSVIDIVDRYLDNTIMPPSQVLHSTTENISKKVRKVIAKGMLTLTGLEELGAQNYATALFRSARYDIGTYYKTPLFQVQRMLRRITSDSPSAAYNISQLRKNVDIIDIANATKLDKIDRFAMGFQELSAKQLSGFGEANATSILHKLPEFDELNNEMKDILKMNNITEKNYKVFKDSIRDHIELNDLYVNVPALNRIAETGDIIADAQKNVYYHLANNIGDVMSKTKYANRASSELQNWMNMFKSFSKAANADTFDRLVHYINAEGLSKSKFSVNYIKQGTVSKDSMAGVLGLMLLGLGGAGYTTNKLLIRGKGTMLQREKLIETKAELLYNNVVQNKDFVGLLAQTINTAGLNPLDVLSPTNLPESILNDATKIYKTFTDEEKIALGTNDEETIMSLINFALTWGVSRVAVNETKSIYNKLVKGDIESLPGKVYGLSKEEYELFATKVRTASLNDMKKDINRSIKVSKAEIDYLNKSNDSFNSLDEKYKVIYSENFKTKNDEYKQIYAMTVHASKNDKELKNNLSEIGVNIEFKAMNEFNSLTDKEKKQFAVIMHNNDLDFSEENVKNYLDFIKDKRGLNDKLKSFYNIDKDSINKKYKDKKELEKALKSIEF